MKRLTLSMVLGLMFSLWLANAAEKQPQGSGQIPRATLMANKRAIVAENMNLTPEQEKIFWPMYDAYQIEINKLNDDRLAAQAKFGITFNNMTDDGATELLNKVLEIEKKRLEVKKSLVEKFGKKFPPKFVARYYQIENKLELAMLTDAAGQTPLMKQ